MSKSILWVGYHVCSRDCKLVDRMRAGAGSQGGGEIDPSVAPQSHDVIES